MFSVTDKDGSCPRPDTFVVSEVVQIIKAQLLQMWLHSSAASVSQ